MAGNSNEGDCCPWWWWLKESIGGWIWRWLMDAKQDCQVLDANPEGPRARHLPQALRGGVQAWHGFRPRPLYHQHRPHRG